MTKDEILSILIADGGYVSGEAISRWLGISRAAVNAAVKALRQEGYGIESTTNRGYLLKTVADKIALGALIPSLEPGRSADVICLDTVTSTNDYLRNLALKGAPSGQVVIANTQTAGKGRRGRQFHSPGGKGIYFSMLLRLDTLPADTAEITAWTAVAISRAIENCCGLRPGIKWINDLVINQSKICGILTEMLVESESGSVQFLIVGIGINANQLPGEFPEEIQGIASSIYAETGRRVDRCALAAEMIIQMDRLRRDWPDGKAAYLAEYRAYCVTPGNEVSLVSVNGQEAAFAESVDDSFALVVCLEDGRRQVVSSGEVSVRGLYGYT